MIPSRKWRAFIRRHPALLLAALGCGLAMLFDRVFGLHALGMVTAIFVALSVADAWDEETMR